MMTCLYVFLGAGLGGVSRYGLSTWLNGAATLGKFPIGIFACNLIGCFLIGLVFALQKESAPAWLNPLLVTGFLGGFTTFSSFGLDTFKLYDAGHHSTALLYVLTTIIGSLVALSLAIKIIR